MYRCITHKKLISNNLKDWNPSLYNIEQLKSIVLILVVIWEEEINHSEGFKSVVFSSIYLLFRESYESVSKLSFKSTAEILVDELIKTKNGARKFAKTVLSVQDPLYAQGQVQSIFFLYGIKI